MNKPSVFQLIFIKLLFACSSLLKSDELYLKIYFFIYTGKWMDFGNVRSFSEKIQWLKIHNTAPEFTDMADKYRMKQYVEGKIGSGYTFPLIGVWDRFVDIDFSLLPDRFVLKTNHDSGGVWIIRDKDKVDLTRIKHEIEERFKKNYFYLGREHPYKNIPHKIIAEQYMEEAEGEDLKDYKVFCFGGEPSFIQVDLDRFTDHKRDFYDIQWDMMDFGIMFPRSYHKIERPEHLEKMLEISRVLSADIPFLRVDLFNIKGKIFVGELTFHPGGGCEKITPVEGEYKLGDMLKLDNYGA